MMKINHTNPLILLFFLQLSFHSCQESYDSSLEIEESVEKLKTKLTNLTKKNEKLAIEEIEKLFSFEYRVASLPSNSSSDVVESNLKLLGKDRWECFHVDKTKDTIEIYCKRRPKTYLRYMNLL